MVYFALFGGHRHSGTCSYPAAWCGSQLGGDLCRCASGYIWAWKVGGGIIGGLTAALSFTGPQGSAMLDVAAIRCSVWRSDGRGFWHWFEMRGLVRWL